MSRKTQIGWISVGVLLCLFSLVLTLKMRDCNKVVAREDDKNATAKPTEAPAPPLPPVSGSPMDGKTEVQLNPPEALPPAILQTGATKPAPKEPVPPLPAGMADVKTPSLPAPQEVKPPLPSDTGKPLPAITLPERKVPTPVDVSTPPLPAPGTIDFKAPPPPLPGTVDSKSPPLSPPTPMPEVKKEVQPVSASVKQEPGEPPMVVPAGPVQIYQVRNKIETLPDIAKRTLGSSERWNEIVRLNPDLKADSVLPFGTTLRLPPDACIQEEADAVKPLPSLRPKEETKTKVLPLTGTYPCNLDERKILTLPKAIREQFGNCDTVLVSPGPDHCLWITNHAHLERLAERIEHSTAKESDVRVFKRLYYAQTEKAAVTGEGRIAISDKLAQFAGLNQESVLVGIDEHFELWDAARWKQYTQQKSAAARAMVDE